MLFLSSAVGYSKGLAILLLVPKSVCRPNRLQTKSMSASMDSSKPSPKSNPQLKSFDPRIEKQSKKTKESEKSRKPNKNVVVVVKKKEAQKGLVDFEKEK
ncbi:hypothetical protein TB2_006503 [Malus domestica]